MPAPPKALLLVYTEPGAHIDEAEYHDWYDNEHVPLRANISEVFTGRINRLKSTDGSKPAFAATYDLESVAALKNPAYTKLTATRSERESNIFAKLGVVDLRVYDAYSGPSVPAPSPRFDETKGAPSTVIIETVIPEGAAEDEYNKWFDEEHLPLVSRFPGWLRSRRFVLVNENSLVFGTDTGAHKRTSPPAKYLTIHEYDTPDASARKETQEYKYATSTEWMAKIEKTVISKSKREFELLKVW
ncbi:hypothetical protein PENSPDRAFT_154043 [Peniophora sp. CONT]|nr:hypothetical protein PENSPDRAFT_154043 [Peniophora sp. CONT]